MRHWLTMALAALTAIGSASLWAHRGGLNADGCHNDRKNGGYHCHRKPAVDIAPVSAPGPGLSSDEAVHYANCSEARAAGAAPVRAGDPVGTDAGWIGMAMALRANRKGL
jgi:hypothetical protein